MKIGIGALSKATGIPVNTLRTWERRYQVPTPVRSEGGQRLYSASEVEHLKLIALALEKGHRPAQIMQATLAELALLTHEVRPVQPIRVPPQGTQLFEAVLKMDEASLRAMVVERLEQDGAVHAIVMVVAPLLETIGCAWEEGQLSPYQEHFASEILRDVLTAWWRPRACAATGPLVVCATLPGERHQLGLHFAAAVLAEAGWRILFLGADTPVSDLEACVLAQSPAAMLLSISCVANPAESRWLLEHLRRQIAPATLVIGGAGAPDFLGGGVVIRDLSHLYQWGLGVRSGRGMQPDRSAFRSADMP